MEWLLALLGVILFFLGPIGFFIAVGNGRRLTTLERQIERLRADLASGAGAAASPEGLERRNSALLLKRRQAVRISTPPAAKKPLRSRPPLRPLHAPPTFADGRG